MLTNFCCSPYKAASVHFNLKVFISEYKQFIIFIQGRTNDFKWSKYFRPKLTKMYYKVKLPLIKCIKDKYKLHLVI